MILDKRDRRPGNTFDIDSSVRSKILILYGNDRQLCRIRNVLVFQIMDIFLSLQLLYLISIHVIDKGSLLGLKSILRALIYDFHGISVHGYDRDSHPHNGKCRQRGKSYQQADDNGFNNSPSHAVRFSFSTSGPRIAAPLLIPAHIYLHDAFCTSPFPVSA